MQPCVIEINRIECELNQTINKLNVRESIVFHGCSIVLFRKIENAYWLDVQLNTKPAKHEARNPACWHRNYFARTIENNLMHKANEIDRLTVLCEPHNHNPTHRPLTVTVCYELYN